MESSQQQPRRGTHQLGIWLAALVMLHATSGLALAQDKSVTITLNEVDVPGISGTATLTAEGEKTRVEMTLSGADVTGDHPTHIHTGTCEDFDPNPTFPLTTVILDPVDETGISATVVDEIALRELLRSDYVILVHKSQEELTTYLVCGEITEGLGLPANGVGKSTQGSAAQTLVVWLGGVAIVLLAGALALRRRVHATPHQGMVGPSSF